MCVFSDLIHIFIIQSNLAMPPETEGMLYAEYIFWTDYCGISRLYKC
jgi:hypothetical protein